MSNRIVTLLFFMSAERHVAVRHPFDYEKQVTEGRIIIDFGLAWVIAQNGTKLKQIL